MLHFYANKELAVLILNENGYHFIVAVICYPALDNTYINVLISDVKKIKDVVWDCSGN